MPERVASHAGQPPKEYNYRIKDWSTNKRVIDWILDNLDRYKESKKRSLIKAVSWRALGTIDTFVLSWIITGQIHLAAAIGGVEVFTKMILYYFHERAWQKIKIK